MELEPFLDFLQLADVSKESEFNVFFNELQELTFLSSLWHDDDYFCCSLICEEGNERVCRLFWHDELAGDLIVRVILNEELVEKVRNNGKHELVFIPQRPLIDVEKHQIDSIISNNVVEDVFIVLALANHVLSLAKMVDGFALFSDDERLFVLHGFRVVCHFSVENGEQGVDVAVEEQRDLFDFLSIGIL